MAEEESPKQSDAAMIVRSLRWPCFLIIAIVLLRTPLSGLLERANNVEFNMGKDGFKAAVNAATNLRSAQIARQLASSGEGTEASTPESRAKETEAVVDSIFDATYDRSFRPATVLWVDDNPDNNIYERQAIGSLGIKFDLARSTDDALAMLSRKSYAAIITDFKREDDPQGGYTLIDAVKVEASKSRHKMLPIIIYSAGTTDELEKAAIEKGAFAQTNDPVRLLDLMRKAIAK